MKASIDITTPEYHKISLHTKAETARDLLPKIEQKEPMMNSERELNPSCTVSKNSGELSTSINLKSNRRRKIKMGK